jgi:hypothetical protein
MLPAPQPPIRQAHSLLGPSSAARLLQCPGSYVLAQTLRREQAWLPETVSEAAERGTQEHRLAERCLQAGEVPLSGGDSTSLDPLPAGEAARLYIETLAAAVYQAPQVTFLLVEEMLDGRRLHPLFFGTVDGAVLVTEPTGRQRLIVHDLKTGSHPVDASSVQLMLYAALVLLDPRTRDAVAATWLVDTVVVQPYASDGGPAVRRARHTRLSILQTARRYLAAARAATGAGATELPRAIGDGCLFCPARPGCPTRNAQRHQHVAGRLAALPPADLDTLAAL